MFLDADASLRVSSDMLGNQVETVVMVYCSPVMEVGTVDKELED
jgi:hypothetical protein